MPFTSSSSILLRWRLLASILIVAMAVQPRAFANPAAPVIRHGAAEFNFDNPAHLLIQQGSDKLIVDWGEFNISAGELTQFIQPGSGSAALNRVMGALPSSIQGQLQANGRVLLINPNGVLIGPGGRIDTAGFIVSTLDVSDADFLTGGDLRFQGNSLAKVVNLGTINAIDGGDIFLIAREVVNAGTLNAPGGTVGLAAGQQIVIAAQGEERVAILPEGQEGSVTNSGTIAAATAELKAAGGNEYALAVNNTGLVRAKGFEKRGGRIYLSVGGGKGRIVNTGTLKARMEDNSGGLVQITHVGEMEGAGVDIGGRIDVKGDVGSGGMVLVTAPGIRVLPDARIDASGKVDGGQIALHSAGNEGTMIDGKLLANGISGDGGFIHVTGSFIGLGATGEISANGGNGGGFVLLGADTEDGAGQVESSQIVLAPGSRISANGMRGDGGMVLINGASDSDVLLGGEISANSDAGVGGQVMAFGGNVSLGGTAMIDASGYRGGGQVYIGGGDRGRDAGKLNSQNTSIAAGAQILANATGAGAGGRVILWADRLMDFQGSVENRGAGGGAGGFTEVSGLEYLGFNGTVDTGGGNLLLDPYSYIIGATEAGNIVTALGLNNVTIDTMTDVLAYGSSGVNTDPGDITVNSAIFYDSTFDLTFLAMGDANFNASVQNRNATGGDINIVAGWDGTTAYNTAAFVAEDVSSTTVFGNSMGSVNIGDGTQLGGVAVGSRSGTTNVFGYDISLQGGNGGAVNGRFAQLGFQVTDEIAQDGTNLGAAPVVDGAITVHALNDVSAMGGDAANFNYAQIGHVGADQGGGSTIEAVASSVIELAVGNNVVFMGGGGAAYAQLGQGGYRARGNHSGTTMITQANDISFTAGSGIAAYAQLGQGGYQANGNQSGNTTIIQANDVSFRGDGAAAYVQLGQGGWGAVGDHSGTTTITRVNDIVFKAGDEWTAYAQLGQGGIFAIGDHSGTTMITQANDITFTGGGGTYTYAQLGQGGVAGQGAAVVIGDHSGNTTVTQANDITFTGGGGGYAFAQLGQGGAFAGGDHSGTTTITQANDIIFTGGLGSGDGSYAQLGQGGLKAIGDHSGTTIILQANDIAFTGGSKKWSYAQLGQGGYDAEGNHSGNISLTHAGNLTLSGADTTDQYALIGHGDQPGDSDLLRTVSGNVTVRTGGNVMVNNGWVGNLLDVDGLSNTGSMNLVADGSITLDNLLNQGSYNTADAYSYIAGGDVNFNASVQNRNATGGDINIVGGWDGTTVYDVAVFAAENVNTTTVFGQSNGTVYIGNGGQAVGVAVGSRSGATNVFGYDLSLQGGNGAGADGRFAQLGFQVTDGIAQDGTDLGAAPVVDGGIVVHVRNDVRATGGDSGNYNYAQIGHVGADLVNDATVEAAATFVLELSAGNNVVFMGGAGDFAYTQLGHGGYAARGDHSGTMTITQANDVSFSGGAGSGAYAQLGHGGYFAEGNHSGNISLTHRGKLTLSGVDTTDQYALIGHGDQPGDGDAGKSVSGNVTVRTGGNAVVNNGWLGNLLDADGLSNTGSMTLAADDGSITLDNLLNQASYDTADAYSYIAGGDVNFNASVQNRNATGGDINIVAGWDGTTVYDTVAFAAEDVNTTVIFGQSNGTVYIGNGGQAVGVAVGSRSGAINVFGYDLSLQGGNGVGADGRFAQLGFQVTDGIAQDGTNLGVAPVVDGGIVVHVSNDVRATGGDSGNHNYAQIGHVGTDQISGTIEAVASSVIELAVGNDLVFTGGGGSFAYVQLGQGGDNAFGNHSGTTTITQVNDIVFTGGDGILSYVQLGQGGNNAIGNHSGITTIMLANDIVFTGVGIGAYAQLGQGGNLAVGNHSGNATITQANNIVFTGGAEDLSYAQLGQGGAFASGNHSGTVTVTQANDIVFTGNAGDFAYAQLGQGGAFAAGNHSGTATVVLANDIIFSGGNGGDAYAQLGQGGSNAVGDHSGTTTINLTHDVRLLGGGGANAFAQLGQGGVGADGNHSGNISLLHSGNLTLTGLDVIDQYALIGHGDEPGDGDASHTVSGDVSIRTSGNTTLTNAFIGHLVDPDGSYTSGNTFIGLAGGLTADAASAFTSAPASDLRFYVAGNDNVNALTLLNGVAHGAAPYPNNQGSYAFGTGPYVPAAGTNFAYYTLAAFYNYNVDTLAETTAIQAALEGGSDVTLAYNIQGQASFGAEYDWGGGPYYIRFDSNLFYDSPNTLNLLATGEVIFNASVQNRNAVGGDVNIVAGWDGITAFDAATFAAEDVVGTSVFGGGMGSVIIGDGSQTGGVAVGSRSGLSSVFGYDVTLQGGTGAGADARFAQLGFRVRNGFAQGGANLGVTPLVNGGITVHTLNDVRATGGDTSSYNYAQIGHVGADFTINGTVEAVATSVIEMSVGNDVVFTAGSGDSAYVQLGQGGYQARGNHSGNTTISQANNLTFMAGDGWGAYAQLGQGGLAAFGNHTGTVTVTRAEDIVFTGGEGNFAYAQLGQGGAFAIGDHSGNILLTQSGNLILTRGRNAEHYARVGNGDRTGDGTGDNRGDVMIRAEGDVTLVKASIGNLIGPAKTYIGVLGDLTADAASNFYSGSSASSGELRFYLGGNDNVNSATLLNGMAHGGTAFPNNQGSFDFGTGPYTLPGPMNPIAGNFNYYSLMPGFYNYTVNTLLEVNAIQAALEGGSDVTLTYNLNQANFGAEYDWDGGTQFIRFDSELFYDSTNTLNLLATGDALFNVSVQNRNATGGDINIVAGWDGATAYNTGVFAAEDVTSSTVYGVGNGMVNIGGGSQVRGVAVGSRSGDTNVFAYDVNLQGGLGAGADRRFAQLGFQVSDQGGGYVVDGGITVHAVNDVSATGGGGSNANYAQIGHVGGSQVNTTIEATATSVIELSAGNNVVFSGGAGSNAYAQLGQGGREANGNHSGTATITQANNVVFSGGTGNNTYAQLGQGGFGAVGNHSGTTTITQANDVSFSGGAGTASYAQLGQGGFIADGNHSGTTTITQANDVVFLGGNGSKAYAQLGQGGGAAVGNHSGTTTITQANDVVFSGGSGAYAQLGQGGWEAVGSHSGTITITQANDVSFTGGGVFGNNGDTAYAQLGQGGFGADGSHSGTTTITRANNVSFTAGFGVSSYAQLGQGGEGANGSHSGNTTITMANNVSFTGVTSSYAQLGQGGRDANGNHSGTTTITQANDVSFLAGSRIASYAQLGQGGFSADGSHSGTTTLVQVNDVTFSGGGGRGRHMSIGAYAQLGQGGFGAFGNHSGTTTITQANNVTFSGGGAGFGQPARFAYAQLGQGGFGANGSHSGTTTITQANNVSFSGGDGDQAYAQLGQGGAAANGSHSGYISLTHSGNLQLIGVDVAERYALIGHGDEPGDGDAGNTVGGDVMVRTGGDVTVDNGWIGHLLDADGKSNTGVMSLISDGNITLSNHLNGGGYDTVDTYSYITGGNVNFNSSAQNRNSSGGDVNIVAGWDGTTAYNMETFVAAYVGSTTLYGNGIGSVRIGDGTQAVGVAVGSRSGMTNVLGYEVSLQGGTGAGADGRFAQLGFQVSDQGAGYVVDGGITVHAVNDVNATGGNGSDFNYVQIGHVGADLSGGAIIEATVTSVIELSAGNDVSFTGGAGDRSYAQLGQGGVGADGNYSGNILLTHDGDLILTGQVGVDRYALIGHGDQPGDSDAGRAVSGDVMIRTGGNATLSNAFIGHLIDPDGSYASGNTFIEVGSIAGPQLLTADSNSGFFSAPTGQLRFYIPGAPANQIAAGASLNGTPAPGPGITPNAQGLYTFGLGPYSLVDPGNFAFYTLGVAPVTPIASAAGGDNLPSMVIMPTFGEGLTAASFLQDIRFIRPVVFERDSWLQWYDYGIEGFVDFLPNASMYTLGSFEVEEDE